MADQKRENLLNLSLSSTEAEREKSINLGSGYEPVSQVWEIIVRYAGDLMSLVPKYPGIEITELMGQYAIVWIRENQLDAFSEEQAVIFIEKPKELYTQTVQGRIASCINPAQAMPYSLTGKGVLAAVIDSGIDYTHPDFRNEDGTTRIAALWDQTIAGSPPEGYRVGTLYTEAVINEALAEPDPAKGLQIVPSLDQDGHGTAVAGIFAGNGRASGGLNRGVATESTLLIVKMANPQTRGFPRTTELMQGIDFVVREAMRRQQPIVINISFGNDYGSHDGQSILESYINYIAEVWQVVIVIAAGNNAAAAGHFSGIMTAGVPLDITLSISAYERELSLQIWKYYGDEMDVAIVAPNGDSSGAVNQILGTQRFYLGETEILLYYGEPSPYNQAQEIIVNFLPRTQYLTEGLWTIRLLPGKIVQGNFEMWIQEENLRNRQTGFLQPIPSLTITIPGTAERAITVGAYNATLGYYADFSGRGYQSAFGRVKPELTAPGVDVNAPAVGGGYTMVSGTSFAAPFVSGAAALLMEYGIVKGNDPYLYGEKMKVVLMAGAKELRGIGSYPDIRVGFGACVIL